MRDRIPRPTFYPERLAPSDEWPTRITFCLVIAIGTAGFFWAYGATSFHSAPYVPSLHTGRDLARSYDDGPAPLAAAEIAPVRKEAVAPQPAVHVAVTRPAKTIPAEAANAFASGADPASAAAPPSAARDASTPSAVANYYPKPVYGAPD